MAHGSLGRLQRQTSLFQHDRRHQEGWAILVTLQFLQRLDIQGSLLDRERRYLALCQEHLLRGSRLRQSARTAVASRRTNTAPSSTNCPSTIGLPALEGSTESTRPATGEVTRAAWSGSGWVVPANSVHSSSRSCREPSHLTGAGGTFSSADTAAAIAAGCQEGQERAEGNADCQRVRTPVNSRRPEGDCLVSHVVIHILSTTDRSLAIRSDQCRTETRSCDSRRRAISRFASLMKSALFSWRRGKSGGQNTSSPPHRM